MNNSISSLERQNQILQFVLRSQRISIMEVCENFSVSQTTARRDLAGDVPHHGVEGLRVGGDEKGAISITS